MDLQCPMCHTHYVGSGARTVAELAVKRALALPDGEKPMDLVAHTRNRLAEDVVLLIWGTRTMLTS